MLKVLFFSVWTLFHPVHVTLTSIDYVTEKVTFKVFVRMYFDDFLTDCRMNGAIVQEDKFSDGNPASYEVLEKYISDKLVLKVNDKQLVASLKNLSVADNEISMNLEFKSSKKPKTLTVKNLIMTSLYSDQANMVIVRINDFEEGVKMTPDLTEQTFNIK
jgi:ribosomal protein S24E